MGDVFVAGAGTTRFGASGASLAALAHEAVRAALADAELPAADVTGVFVGCRGTGSVPGADALTLRLGLRRVGLVPGGSDGHEHVSAAGVQALHRAWRAVENGTCDVAVCVGAERLPAGTSGLPPPTCSAAGRTPRGATWPLRAPPSSSSPWPRRRTTPTARATRRCSASCP
jgi:acetyl-CoA acetyltransferase